MAKETRTIMKRWLTILASGAMALGTLAISNDAAAQEIQLTGPLAGAPAVRRLRHYREGRFELGAGMSATLLDEYRRTYFVTGRLQYNLFDWLGVGVFGGYGLIGLSTDLTDQIDSVSPRNSRTAVNVGPRGKFADQTARYTYMINPQLVFSPFRGKLAIFQKLFVDTDLYVHGGVAFVGLQERGDCGGPGKKPCSDPTTFGLESRTAVAPSFGLGLSLYTTNFISLAFEYRAFPFSWNRAGFDQRGGGNDAKFPDQRVDAEDRTFSFNQMFTLQAGFYLPTLPKTTD